MTASPEAITSATPRTRASLARVSAGSEADKPQCGLVTTFIPQHVELGRDLLQIKSNTVRLVGLRGALDKPRPLRQLANQRQLRRIGEPVERPAGQCYVGQIVLREPLDRMAHDRGRAGVGVLHIEDRVVLGLVR